MCPPPHLIIANHRQIMAPRAAKYGGRWCQRAREPSFLPPSLLLSSHTDTDRHTRTPIHIHTLPPSLEPRYVQGQIPFLPSDVGFPRNSSFRVWGLRLIFS